MSVLEETRLASFAASLQDAQRCLWLLQERAAEIAPTVRLELQNAHFETSAALRHVREAQRLERAAGR